MPYLIPLPYPLKRALYAENSGVLFNTYLSQQKAEISLLILRMLLQGTQSEYTKEVLEFLTATRIGPILNLALFLQASQICQWIA